MHTLFVSTPGGRRGRSRHFGRRSTAVVVGIVVTSRFRLCGGGGIDVGELELVDSDNRRMFGSRRVVVNGTGCLWVFGCSTVDGGNSRMFGSSRLVVNGIGCLRVFGCSCLDEEKTRLSLNGSSREVQKKKKKKSCTNLKEIFIVKNWSTIWGTILKSTKCANLGNPRFYLNYKICFKHFWKMLCKPILLTNLMDHFNWFLKNVQTLIVVAQ